MTLLRDVLRRLRCLGCAYARPMMGGFVDSQGLEVEERVLECAGVVVDEVWVGIMSDCG